MAIVNFTPQRFIKYLEEGEYQGVLRELSYNEYEDNESPNNEIKKIFWFRIEVNGKLFCSMLSIKSRALNEFAFSCLNEEGQFDTDIALNKSVKFSVMNRAGKEYSRISKIEILK